MTPPLTTTVVQISRAVAGTRRAASHVDAVDVRTFGELRDPQRALSRDLLRYRVRYSALASPRLLLDDSASGGAIPVREGVQRKLLPLATSKRVRRRNLW